VTTRVRSRVRALVISALVLWAGTALGDGPSLSESLHGEAKIAYEGGKLLFKDHDFEGAATKFKVAYHSSRDPRLLWNLATCEKQMRHYARASELVDRYLAEAAKVASPELLDEARRTQVALHQFFSAVTLQVKPDGARVLLDGKEVGQAPIESPVPVDVGSHTLRAEKDGFKASEISMLVPGQTPMSFTISLVEDEARGILTVVPADASDAVSLDGQVVGTGRWEGPLTAGAHHVTVTAPGKATYEKEVEVAAGDRRTLDVTLQDAHKSSVWPWVGGGAGAVALTALIAGGYFALKPHDTQAPQPVGALGTVTLGSK